MSYAANSRAHSRVKPATPALLAAKAARAALVDGYAAQRDLPASWSTQRLVRLFLLAAEPFRRQLPDWPVATGALLDQIETMDAAERAEAQRLAHRMAERALALGGTVTGEHGVGMGKLDYMAAEHGAGWDVMGQLKAALDPAGILNPGKVVPQPG